MGTRGLVSKIANTYNSLPPELRDQASPPDDDHQNPELDRTFDQMLAANIVEIRRLHDGSRSPGTPDSPSDEATAVEKKTDAGAAPLEGDAGQWLQGSAQPAPSNTPVEYHRHEHYHSSPYLLLAIALLLGLVAWQQWQLLHKQSQPSPTASAQPAHSSPKPMASPPPPPAIALTPAAASESQISAAPPVAVRPTSPPEAQASIAPPLGKVSRRLSTKPHTQTTPQKTGRDEDGQEVIWHLRPSRPSASNPGDSGQK